MSTLSFVSSLLAAREAAGGQSYPPGTLYIVATPIGNLSDISLRALYIFQLADVVACEDTRHTQRLLNAYGLGKDAKHLFALHQHNEAEGANAVVALLAAGKRVAYVSDAGTPGVSDPGAKLTQIVRTAGFNVIPIPGASAITALLSVSGIASADDFIFLGFMPTKSGERLTAINHLHRETRTVVLLEAPHRIQSLAAHLKILGTRLLTVGREITKQFEQIETMAAADFTSWLEVDANRSKGEFSIVVHPNATLPNESNGDTKRILTLLLEEVPLKTAVKLAADITGIGRNELYQSALRIKNQLPEQQIDPEIIK